MMRPHHPRLRVMIILPFRRKSLQGKMTPVRKRTRRNSPWKRKTLRKTLNDTLKKTAKKTLKRTLRESLRKTRKRSLGRRAWEEELEKERTISEPVPKSSAPTSPFDNRRKRNRTR